MKNFKALLLISLLLTFGEIWGQPTYNLITQLTPGSVYRIHSVKRSVARLVSDSVVKPSLVPSAEGTKSADEGNPIVTNDTLTIDLLTDPISQTGRLPFTLLVRTDPGIYGEAIPEESLIQKFSGSVTEEEVLLDLPDTNLYGNETAIMLQSAYNFILSRVIKPVSSISEKKPEKTVFPIVLNFGEQTTTLLLEAEYYLTDVSEQFLTMSTKEIIRFGNNEQNPLYSVIGKGSGSVKYSFQNNMFTEYSVSMDMTITFSLGSYILKQQIHEDDTIIFTKIK